MSRLWLLAAVVASLAIANALTPDPQCVNYCNIMFGYCTGANSVFGPATPLNEQWCITECEIIFNYRNNTLSTADANTWACRWKYAQAAISNPSNCQAAAPWSKKCVTPTITGPTAVSITPNYLCDNYCDKQAILCGGSILPTYHNRFFSGATYTGISSLGGTTTTLDARDQCLLECTKYSQNSTDSPLNANPGDSLNCRFYHITLVAKNMTAWPAQVHCPHSGPAGGSPNNMVCWNPPVGVTLPKGGDFVYGSCLNYCDIVMAACPGILAGGGEAYPSYTSCLGACLSFPFVTNFTATATFNMQVATGDSFECRRHWALQTIFDSYPSTSAATLAQVNCVVAGNFGGDVPAATPSGFQPICGDACSFYCDEMNGNAFNNYTAGHCTVAQGGFPDWKTCYSQCKTNLDVQAKRAKITQLIDQNQLTASDTLECRVVWAGLAATPGKANAYCAAASIASAPGFCQAAKSSTGGGSHASSSGLNSASAVQVSFSVLLVACFAAFFGSRRM